MTLGLKCLHPIDKENKKGNPNDPGTWIALLFLTSPAGLAYPTE
jgi:hypothetical protein